MRRMSALAPMLAGASLIAAGAAHAEEATRPSGAPIIVTATKKAGGENAQDAALAVTVFDGEALAKAQFRDLQSLSYAVPGVSLDQVGTFRGVANFAIRGLGINSSIPSIDAAVGTVIDGVHIAGNGGLVFDGFDIASVEIARGPQGVLYGRNTTGGAVLVNTADPAFDWQGFVRLSGEGPGAGGRGAMRMTGQAVISGPLAADRVAVRLGVHHDSDGGYFRNRFDGSNFGKAETTVLRAGLKALATERLTLTVKGEYLRTHGDGATTQSHGLFDRKGFQLSVNEPGRIRSSVRFATARLDYELANGAITNVLGWRDYRHVTTNDIDSTPAFLFHSGTGQRQEQWSNELRYAGSFGALDVTAGGYLFHQDIAYAEDRSFSATATVRPYGGGTQDHDVLGLFANADWHATDALTLSAGVRWSHENKRAEIIYVRNRPACWVIAGTCPVTGTNPLIPGENNGLADKRSWSSLNPKLGLRWRFSDDVMAYASWARGTRSGGYNLRVAQPAAFEAVAAARGTASFGEETVDTAELGLKWRGADGRATVNIALWRTGVDDMQREIILASASAGTVQYIYNTADARLHGGEIEAAFAVTPALRLTANAGHINARYTRVFFDLSGDAMIDAADRALEPPRAPAWTWGFGATHELALGAAARITTSARFQHRGRYAYTDNNWGFNAASDMLDASVALDLGSPAITLTLYGKNLLDAVQFGGDTQLTFGAGPFSDGNNRPFDPRPSAGSFSPMFKGRVLGLEAAMAF